MLHSFQSADVVHFQAGSFVLTYRIGQAFNLSCNKQVFNIPKLRNNTIFKDKYINLCFCSSYRNLLYNFIVMNKQKQPKQPGISVNVE